MRSIAVAIMVMATPAYAGGLPVTDAAVETTTTSMALQQIKDAAVQAKQLATEIGSYAQLVNTYFLAAQNTIAIPMATIAHIQGIYDRAAGIAQASEAVISGNGTTMQRLSALKAVGMNAGNMPGSIASSAQFTKDQWQRQIDSDVQLLGLEDERRAVADDLLGESVMASRSAVGQLAAIQAQGEIVKSSAEQVKQTNMILAAMWERQLVKDQTEIAQRQAIEAAATERTDAMKMMYSDVGAAGMMNSNPVTWGN